MALSGEGSQKSQALAMGPSKAILIWEEEYADIWGLQHVRRVT